MSVPPRPSFLSAELKVICLHLDNLGIIMHFRIYSQYHIMLEKRFLGHSQPLQGGGRGHVPRCSPTSLGRHCQNNQLITNVLTAV